MTNDYEKLRDLEKPSQKRPYARPEVKKIDDIARLVAMNEGPGADGSPFTSDAAS